MQGGIYISNKAGTRILQPFAAPCRLVHEISVLAMPTIGHDGRGKAMGRGGGRVPMRIFAYLLDHFTRVTVVYIVSPL